MSKTIYYQGPVLELPWSSATREQSRFKWLSLAFILLFIIVAIIIPLVPVPELAREEQEKLPDNLARLLIEEPIDIPEPVVEEPIPVEPEPVVEEELEVVEPEEVIPEPEPEIVEPEPPAPPPEIVEEARQRASVSGLLQFQDDLQQMRDMVDVEAISTADLRNASSEETEVRRDLLSSGAQSESGGIVANDISVNAGGIAVSGKENTYVDSSLALPGGIGSEALYEDEAATASGGLPPRSEEETRRVMDANKSAIFAIYNRALRSDPTLEGKFLVEIVVEPDGYISSVNLISSQLDDSELEQRLLTRIRLIQFPAGSYATTTINQTFDFLPY